MKQMCDIGIVAIADQQPFGHTTQQGAGRLGDTGLDPVAVNGMRQFEQTRDHRLACLTQRRSPCRMSVYSHGMRP